MAEIIPDFIITNDLSLSLPLHLLFSHDRKTLLQCSLETMFLQFLCAFSLGSKSQRVSASVMNNTIR